MIMGIQVIFTTNTSQACTNIFTTYLEVAYWHSQKTCTKIGLCIQWGWTPMAYGSYYEQVTRLLDQQKNICVDWWEPWVYPKTWWTSTNSNFAVNYCLPGCWPTAKCHFLDMLRSMLPRRSTTHLGRNTFFGLRSADGRVLSQCHWRCWNSVG